MSRQSCEPIDYDDETVFSCLKADRKRWEAAAARDLRTLDDWIKTRLDAAANRELRETEEQA